MEGEIYTEVDASVLNPGISTMAMVSGDSEPPEGVTPVYIWIRWRYDDVTGEGGFTGSGWYIGDPNNVLSEHYSTEEAYITDLLANGKPWLDNLLQSWDESKKILFFVNNQAALGAGSCFDAAVSGA